jgi:hypothetical protein
MRLEGKKSSLVCQGEKDSARPQAAGLKDVASIGAFGTCGSRTRDVNSYPRVKRVIPQLIRF